MNYKFTEQYAKDEEKLLAEFKELNDANIFAMGKTHADEIEKEILFIGFITKIQLYYIYSTLKKLIFQFIVLNMKNGIVIFQIIFMLHSK